MSGGLGLLVRRRASRLAIAAASSALAAAIGLVPAYVVYRIAAAMLSGDLASLPAVLPWLIGLAAAAVVAKAALQAISTHVAHVGAYDILRDVRIALAEHLARLPIGALGGRTIGSTRKILHDDVEQIEGVLSHAIPDIAAALTAPVVAIILMSVVDPWLGLVLFLPIPAILLLYWRTLTVSEEARGAYFSAFGRLGGLVVQYVRGMKVIKAFTRANASYAELTRAIDELAAATEAFAGATLKPFVAMLTLLRGVVIVVLPLGAMLVAFGVSEPASLALALLLAIGVAPSLAKLTYSAGQAFWRMKMARAEIDRLFALPPLPEPAAPEIPQSHSIAFDDVTLDIDGRPILSGVTFEARAGSVTALVGPSGAGKTTVARLAARMMDPTRGVVRLGGVDLREVGSDALMARVAFVFQDTFLFDDTVRANIRVGRPDASDAEIEAAARRAGVMSFAGDLEGGLDAAVGEDGGRLSGGQRQRVAIARALLKGAPVVILDEATASLDPDSEREVHEALAQLSVGRTVLIVAHRLETIRSADRIVVLKDGEVEAAGRHEELLATSPTYRDQWRAYVRSEGWRFSATKPAAPAKHGQPPQGDDALAAPDGGYERLSESSPRELFLRLLGPEKRRFFRRAMPLQFAESLFHGAPILAVALSLNDLVTGALTPARAGLYALVLAACFAVQTRLHLAALRAFWRIQPRAVASLQKAVAFRLRRLPLSYFLSADAGRLNSLISTHPAQIDFITAPGQFLRAVVAPPIAAVVLALIDWRLTLLLIAGTPVYLLLLARTDRVFREVFASLVEVRADADRAMLEFLRGLPVIRAFGMTARSAARFEAAMTAYRDASLASVARVTPLYGAGVAVIELGFVAVVGGGALLVVAGAAPVGTFLLFAVLSLAFYAPILDMAELSSHRRLVERSMAQVGAAFEAEVLPEPHPERAAEPDGLDIEFDRIRFAYARRTVLQDVSFVAEAGRMTALVGPSGAGKTTLAHLAARFWDVDGGAVRIGGVDVRRMPSSSLYDRIAMVFQDDVLFDESVAANLRLGRPEATDAEIERAARAARIHERVERLPDGYATRLGEATSHLSGGERQRLAIARALVKDAPIILLDEATAAIDPENEILIREALAELTQGRTVLVIAHRLASIAAADQIVVLTRDGRVAGAGRHERLLADCAAYKALWDAQQAGDRWRASA